MSKTVLVNGIGRKSYPIALAEICKALQASKREDGQPNYSAAARYLKKQTGQKLTPGFVHSRIKREALEQGIDRDEFLNRVMNT